MGLTQRLGTIPLAIQTDSSNNVGIGGAANASYKLQVTGTTNLTGALTGTSATFSGNIGLGLTPSSWSSVFEVIEGGDANNQSALAFQNSANVVYLTTNSYFDGSWKYKFSDSAGQYLIDGNEHRFYTAAAGTAGNAITWGTPKLTIASTGSVGIGTGSPSNILHTSVTTNGTSVGALFANPNQAGTADAVTINFGLGRSTDAYLFSIPAIKFGKEQQWTSTGSTVDGYLSFSTMLNESVTERMRITSGGNVSIGYSAAMAGAPLGILSSSASQQAISIWNNATSGTRYFIEFSTGSSYTAVGSITTNGSTTSYNTTSDYRLKQDLKDYNGLSIINLIKTYDYEWKYDNTRSYGVLAHELESVLPLAVTGKKDGERMQGVDYSKLVPVLVKAIQELNAKVTALENK